MNNLYIDFPEEPFDINSYVVDKVVFTDAKSPYNIVCKDGFWIKVYNDFIKDSTVISDINSQIKYGVFCSTKYVFELEEYLRDDLGFGYYTDVPAEVINKIVYQHGGFKYGYDSLKGDDYV
jgi:hypothetical protein